MEGNNLDPKIGHLRNVFLEAEREYLEELMLQPKMAEMVGFLNEHHSGSQLARIAQTKIDAIENEEVKWDDLEQIEGEITLLLAAIEDMQRERGQREKSDDWAVTKRGHDDNREMERQ